MSTTDPFAQDIGDTLAQVNVVRQAMGYDPLYELPNAHRGQVAACLYYRALADCGAKAVYGDTISFASERQARLVADLWGTRISSEGRVMTPPQMSRTIGRFDDQKLPHYHEDSTNIGPTYEEDADEGSYEDEDEDEG